MNDLNHDPSTALEDTQQIAQNFIQFRHWVSQAQTYLQQNRYEAAAVYSSIAAYYASAKHCGIFTSPELEAILLCLGDRAISPPQKIPPQIPRLQHILHVATHILSIGGHSKMLKLWIEQDAQRCHSLALTRQESLTLPEAFPQAIRRRHGQIHCLDQFSSSFIERAKQLRKIAETADIIILHISNNDIIPLIAFANPDHLPPVIFVNHADHLFWVGKQISRVIANLRESGQVLSQQRRGIDPQRNQLLPILLAPTSRQISRQEAKRKLGLAQDSILLLSIARKLKYNTDSQNNYVAIHLPILEKYPQTYLAIVGPGQREDWAWAVEKTQGRILLYSECQETELFRQAADIYVDSFPVASNTSLLESGYYSVPLVSLFPYTEEAIIHGADMPSLTGYLMQAKTIEDYQDVLSQLINNEPLRQERGEATCQSILATHCGEAWQKSLENLYQIAIDSPPISRSFLEKRDEIKIEVSDLLLLKLNTNAPSPHQRPKFLLDLLLIHIRNLPFQLRFLMWFKLLSQYKNNALGRSKGVSFLLSPRIYKQLKSFRLKENP